MSAIKRLVLAYFGVGFLIALIENLTAHLRTGTSILDVVAGPMPVAEKVSAALDLVVFPIVAWPLRVLELIRGG